MKPPSGPKKQTQFKPNFPSIQLISVAIDVNMGNYKEGFEKRNIANLIFNKLSMGTALSAIFLK